MKLFVYGTLIFDEILSKLLGKTTHQFQDCWKIIKLKNFNAEFPGIVKDATSNVLGKIILDINDHDTSILDTYEGVMYKRIILKVKTISNDMGQVYVVDDYYKRKLSEEAWCPLEFRNKYLNNYIKNLN